MKGSIYRRLQSIINKKDYTRFHMPGHKGRAKSLIDWYKYDVTEIPGSDNLSNPQELILEVMDTIADIYNVKSSFLLVNGSTAGIIASILSVCKSGDSLVIPRNSHRSVYSALLLHEIEPIYLYDTAGANGEYPSISVHEVERAFIENLHCKGVIITSPTYQGVCYNIKEISRVSKQYGKVLLVDEAHGAHLKFNNKFPLSGVESGADLVIQSTHKTLSSLNQGALLHVCSDNVNRRELTDYLNMLQTTSPSYPIMMSIEHAVRYAQAYGAHRLDKLIYYYEYMEEELKGTPFYLKGTELLESGHIFDYDKSKLWIGTRKVPGPVLSERLREEYHIQVEMWDSSSILAMMGMGTKERDIKKLAAALKEMSGYQEEGTYEPHSNVYSYPIVKMAMNPWETLKCCKEVLPLATSKGRISGELIIPYPPGIPVLVPGEIITDAAINFINNWPTKDVVGLTKDGNIPVIRE